jgi:hypothetical protein
MSKTREIQRERVTKFLAKWITGIEQAGPDPGYPAAVTRRIDRRYLRVLRSLNPNDYTTITGLREGFMDRLYRRLRRSSTARSA